MQTMATKYAAHASKVNSGTKTVHQDQSMAPSSFKARKSENTNKQLTASHISKMDIPNQLVNSFFENNIWKEGSEQLVEVKVF